MPGKPFSKKPWWQRLKPPSLFSPKLKWQLQEWVDRVYLKLIRYVTWILVALTVVIIGFATFAVSRSRSQLSSEELKTEYHAGLMIGNYKRAATALDALQVQADSTSDLQFDRAVLECKLGDKQLGQKVFEELSQSGDVRSSVWLLKDLFGEADLAKLDTDQAKRFGDLLLRSSNAQSPDDRATVNDLASRYYLANGQPRRAINYLQDQVEAQPETHLTLARAYQSLGETAEASKHLKKAADHFSIELSKKIDDVPLRLRLIQTHVTMKEEETALVIATKGFQLMRDPKFQQAGSQALLAWAQRLKEESGKASLEQQITLVFNATQLTPQDPQVIQALQTLLIECHQDTGSEQRLSRSLAAGVNSESLHFFMGLHFLLHDQFDSALQHLELAQGARSGNITQVLSAFLVEYASGGSAQRARASSIAQRLIEHSPADGALQSAWQQLSGVNPAPDKAK